MVLQESACICPQRSLSVEVLRELIWTKSKGQTWKIAAAFDHGHSGSVGLRELAAGLKKLQIVAQPSEVAELFSQLCQQRRTATVLLADLTRSPKQLFQTSAAERKASAAASAQLY